MVTLRCNISANGKWLMAQSEFPSTATTFFQARIWEIATHQEIITDTEFVIFGPDGNKAALHSSANILISQLPPTKEVIQLPHPPSRQSVAFSPDGKLLASGSWNPRYEDGDVYIWDVTTGKQLAYIPLETYQEKFSPDHQWLAGFTAKGFRVWDTMTGREIISTHGTDMGFSPDGPWLAISYW
jgi:WD40 repeat protein